MDAIDTVAVAPANQATYEAWNGPEGGFWVERETVFDRSVDAYDRALLDAADIGPSDVVLDVGCGTGSVTRQAAARAVAGRVVGIDLSAPMLRRARERAAAEGVQHVDLVHGDAQVHPFADESFDVVVSRTGTMFFADPVAAFANLRRALRPEGRLAMVVWQPVPRNTWFVEWARACLGGAVPTPPAGAPGPFSLADADHLRTVLLGAGLADVRIEGHQQPMWVGADADAAFGFVRSVCAGVFGLNRLDPPARDAAFRRLRESVDAHAGPHGVAYPGAAWVVTATR